MLSQKFIGISSLKIIRILSRNLPELDEIYRDPWQILRNSPELLLQTHDLLQISVFNYLNERRSEHCGILMDVGLDDNSIKEKSAFWRIGTSVDISFSALNLMMEIFKPLFIVLHTLVRNFANKCATPFATQGTL